MPMSLEELAVNNLTHCGAVAPSVESVEALNTWSLSRSMKGVLINALSGMNGAARRSATTSALQKRGLVSDHSEDGGDTFPLTERGVQVAYAAMYGDVVARLATTAARNGHIPYAKLRRYVGELSDARICIAILEGLATL